jgi:lipopolysaccharide/colanic/teichoic acid biosynthesis glycosyltransferase
MTNYVLKKKTVSPLNWDFLNFKQQLFNQHKWLEQFASEQPLLQGRSYLMTKRVMDLILCLASLPITSLLLMFCAILIKLEDPGGPILFILER